MNPQPAALRRANARRTAVFGLTGLLVLSLSTPLQAQSHNKSVGGYTLRSSVAPTTAVAESALASYGIEPAPRRALLDVVVLKNKKQGVGSTVLADVEAHARTLAGMERPIDLRSASANGRTSYVGVFEHAAGEVLDFEIVAVPEGTDQKIVLRYQDKMRP